MRNLTTMEIEIIAKEIEKIVNDDDIVNYASDYLGTLGNAMYKMNCDEWIGETKIAIAEYNSENIICVVQLDFFFDSRMLEKMFNYSKVEKLTVDENGIKVVLE